MILIRDELPAGIPAIHHLNHLAFDRLGALHGASALHSSHHFCNPVWTIVHFLYPVYNKL